MSIETVSVEQTMRNKMKLKWKGRWGNGFEVRWVRCGLGGLLPVVMTPFGRLGVGFNHHVEAASLAGTRLVTDRTNIKFNDATEEEKQIIIHERNTMRRHKLPKICLVSSTATEARLANEFYHSLLTREEKTAKAIMAVQLRSEH